MAVEDALVLADELARPERSIEESLMAYSRRRYPRCKLVVDSSVAGPFTMQSPVRETTKFMDITRLLALRAHPELSKRISKHVADLTRLDQTRAFLRAAYDALAHGQSVALTGTENDLPVTYRISPPADFRHAAILTKERLTLTSGTIDAPGVEFVAERAMLPFKAKARELVLVGTPDGDDAVIYARLEAHDAVLDYDGEQTPLQGKEWNVAVPMGPELTKLSDRTANEFLKDSKQYSKDEMTSLLKDVVRQRNQIESELHARCSFAFSCLLLSLVGAMIGMMTRSGNFVTAFAVSVGPALVAIVLIVTGQHICESSPRVYDVTRFDDPLKVGLPVLWSGCVAVAVLGTGLYYKLSRT